MRAYRESFVREDGRKGITQTELLRLMGTVDPEYARRTGHGTVSRWESGETPLTVRRIRTFGKALNLSENQVEGIILLAGLDPWYQENKTLTCPQCGQETVTTDTEMVHGYMGDEPAVTAAARTRKCTACGNTAESTERWSNDPVEKTNRTMEHILQRIEIANFQIRDALAEANTLHRPNPAEEWTHDDSALSDGEDNLTK